MNNILRLLPRIHKEGYSFILIFFVTTLFIWQFFTYLGFAGAVLTGWCIYFFRDPNRMVPTDKNYVVSPADGVVTKIEKASPPPELELGDVPMTRISIFLSVFNVHVNRVPAAGKITKLQYHPGKFLNATLDKASIHNERQAVLMETTDGRQIIFTQIAGLIARRIVCNLDEEQTVKAGERFGIIRFGSRMDVFLPEGVAPLVVEGQIAIGGETILANLEDKKVAQRTGDLR